MAETDLDRSETGKSAAEIERDIDQTRAEIDDTLDRIFTRLTPGEMFEQLIDYVRSSHGISRFGAVMRENPIPVVLTALGIGWLAIAGMRGGRVKRVEARLPPPGYADRVALRQGRTTGAAEYASAPLIGTESAVDEAEARSFEAATRATDESSEPPEPRATDRSSV